MSMKYTFYTDALTIIFLFRNPNKFPVYFYACKKMYYNVGTVKVFDPKFYSTIVALEFIYWKYFYI